MADPCKEWPYTDDKCMQHINPSNLHSTIKILSSNHLEL